MGPPKTAWDSQKQQKALTNFSSSNIKNITELASLTVWRVAAENGKTFDETWPDRLH